MKNAAYVPAVSDLQLNEIGFNNQDKDIYSYVASIIENNGKNMEMLTVYLQEEMKEYNRKFKTHLISETSNYATWRKSAEVDYDHLDLIAERTVSKQSSRYDDYLYEIDTAKYELGYD